MLKKSISVLIVIVMIISVFTIIPISVEAGTFSNVSGFPDFDMDCYVADLFTTDGHTLNTLIDLELNSESRNKLMKNSIESNSILMGSMTAWQVATFQPSDTSHDTVTQIGYYESIILSALNASIKSTAVKDTFDNAAIKNGKSLFSSYKSILKAEYALEFSDTTSFNSLSSTEQDSVISSFNEAFKKQYPAVNDISKFLKVFGAIVKSAKSIEECMGLFASYYQCNLVNDYLCQVVNDLYEQCPDSNITMKAALLNISSACTSTELDLGAESLDAIYRGFDILYGVVVDGWFDSVIAASPAGIGILIGQAVGKGVSNFLFSTDEICENYYKICCLDEFEQLTRSVTKHEMENYKKDRTNYNANCLFSALALMFNLNDVGCDLSIDYAKTIYEKSIAGIFLDKTEYENYKKTVEFIRGCKRADYSTLMTSYVFYLEEDYPEIYAAYMKVMDEIENPVVHATGISFSKKHMTLGLEDDMFYFWNNAEVTPSNATNRAVSYTSSDANIVSIEPSDTLKLELHQTGTVTITATSEDGIFTDTLTIDVVEGHGIDGIHLEDPASDIDASGSCGNNVYWKLCKSGLIKVYGTGKMTDFSNSKTPWNNKKESIKSVMITSGVTSIGNYAFYDCVNISNICIPDSVTIIGKKAFYNCSSLIDVSIPNSVVTVGDYAFDSCNALTKITIPDSVMSIGYQAFYGCSSLKDINITDIGAFLNIKYTYNGNSNANPMRCNGNDKILSLNGTIISEITIPNSVTAIGNYSFYKCSNLAQITVPTSVKSIGEEAFFRCTNLKSINIPNSITSIGKSAFDGCSTLSNVTLSNSVETLEYMTFGDCKNLASIVIPDSVKTIGDYAFSGCNALTSIVIPDSVTSIGWNTFMNCTSLTDIYISNISSWLSINFTTFSISNPLDSNSKNKNLYINGELTTRITVPDSIETIDRYAFKNLTFLTDVIISDSVTIIDYRAFEGAGIKNMYISKAVKDIKDGAFINCKSLTDVYYGGSQTEWNEIQIGENNEYLTGATIHFNSEGLHETVYAKSISLSKSSLSLKVDDNENLTVIIYPSNTTDKSVTWSSSNTNVATVSNGTVTAKSSGKAEITAKTSNGLIATCIVTVIPKTIAATGITLNKSSLSLLVGNSEQLTATVTPSNATDNTVKWTSSNTNVAKVTNGKVTAIKEGLATITAKTSNGLSASCTITVSEINNPIDEDDFHYTIFKNPGEETEVAIYDYTGSAATLIIPDKLEEYPVKSIWDDAFKDCDKLTAVVIPDSVEYIGDNVFENCTNLESVIIPDNVKGIGWKSFYNCEKLISITIPAGVTSIEGWTFCNCQSLQSVRINGQITDIDSHAFCDCFSLKEFVIPSTVTELGEQAFWGCSSLRSISIPAGITEINYATFKNCTGLKDVYYSGSESQWKSIVIGEDNDCLQNATIHFGITNQINPTEIKLNKTILMLSVGKIETLKATVLPSNVTDKSVVWASNNPDVASIVNGRVSALKEGSAIITAKTSNGKTATCSVTVLPDENTDVLVGDFDIDGSITIVDATFIQRYLASIPIPDGFNLSNADTDGDGSVTIIDATFIQRFLASLADHFYQPEKVSLNTTEKTLNVGDKFTLISTITPADATNKSITWSSSNNSIATVSNGVVTAIASGTATITAKAYNGKAAKCSVTVKSNTVYPTSVALKADASTLTVGFTTRLLPVVYPSNVTDKSVTLSNSDESVVSVTTDGENHYWMTGKAPGKATITATTSNGKSAKFTINVVNPQPTSIRPDYGTYYLSVGEATVIKPLFEPYNAQTTVSWKSGDESIAKVDSSGNVTAISEGNTTITLSTDNGKSNSCIVYVNKIKIGDFYAWIDDNLKVLNSMYSQVQGRIVGKDSLSLIYPFNDQGKYANDYDDSKFSDFNRALRIIENSLTVRANKDDFVGFYKSVMDGRTLDNYAYNSVVKHLVDAFYDTCSADYYYTWFSSGDIEFSDFEDRYIQCVKNERMNQKLALDEIVSYLYNSSVYGNSENKIYNELRAKITNVKTKSDAAELLAYFEKNFSK